MSGLRPSSHQHDLAYSGRPPSDSTSAIPPLSLPRDDLRLHNNRGVTHDLSSHPQSQADWDGGGRAQVIGGMGLGKGGHLVVNNESGEHEAIARRLVHDSEIDPALKDVSGFVVASDAGGGGEPRDVGDGFQSLPSLKSSGLLDWTSRLNDGVPKQLARGGAPSHTPHPNPHPAHDGDARSTSLVSTMPVGLQWLANESR